MKITAPFFHVKNVSGGIHSIRKLNEIGWSAIEKFTRVHKCRVLNLRFAPKYLADKHDIRKPMQTEDCFRKEPSLPLQQLILGII